MGHKVCDEDGGSYGSTSRVKVQHAIYIPVCGTCHKRRRWERGIERGKAAQEEKRDEKGETVIGRMSRERMTNPYVDDAKDGGVERVPREGTGAEQSRSETGRSICNK